MVSPALCRHTACERRSRVARHLSRRSTEKRISRRTDDRKLSHGGGCSADTCGPFLPGRLLLPPAVAGWTRAARFRTEATRTLAAFQSERRASSAPWAPHHAALARNANSPFQVGS